MMKYLYVSRGIQLGMAILFTTTVAISSQMDSKLAECRQQNAQALRQYTWKARTEIRKGGETKNVRVEVQRYDSNGTLQKTTISSTPQQQLPTRGLRGLIAQKKKEDFMGTLDGLGRLAKSYGDIRPDEMQRFLASSSVTPETGPQEKLVRIAGVNVLQLGDSMTLWVDAASHKQRRVEIQTTLDKKPVRIVSEFQDLPMGPTYMARSVIDYPSAEMTVITENFDYQGVTR